MASCYRPAFNFTSLRGLAAAALLALCVALPAQGAEADNWKSVFSFQQKMAQMGNAEAQYRLAEMYEQGLGTEKNLDEALSWYRQSSGKGYLPATERLQSLQARKGGASS